MSAPTSDPSLMLSIKQEDDEEIKTPIRKLGLQQAKTNSTLRRMITELSSSDETKRSASESDGGSRDHSIESDDELLGESGSETGSSKLQSVDELLGETDDEKGSSLLGSDSELLGERGGGIGSDLLLFHKELLGLLGESDGGNGCDMLESDDEFFDVSESEDESDLFRIDN
ncbi:MAG: hypothetical protein Q9175_005469, partial [Cornicularia normoerica]